MKTLLHIALGLLLALTAVADTVTKQDVVSIPAQSVLYRLKLVNEVTAAFGDVRPVARIAAQVHQESRWNPAAASKYAQGMAQFTPATAAWIGTVCPALGATPDVWDPNWSMRAAVCYDRHLFRRFADAASECDRWAMTLSAYNGGPGWVARDRKRAALAGADPNVWFGHVELHSARAQWAMRENRGYVERITLRVEPVYLAAGWPGEAVCHG